MAINSKPNNIFPVGYHKFNKNPAFNYQLNRYFSVGQGRFEDLKKVGENVNSIEDWSREMLEQGELAASEGRFTNAAAYYRAAEFYLDRSDPKKEQLYDKFISTFNQAFASDNIERFQIPYGDAFLPAIRITAKAPVKKSTILIHGGNDSFMEEIYPIMRYFAEKGHTVIGFEGPGQGSALKKYGLFLDQDWEKPTSAVLDYFQLDNVTMLGISMGGWLCLRAAAHEPRISRAIAWSVSYDVLKYTNAFGEWAAKLMFKYFRNFTNNAALRRAKKEVEYSWFINNLMYITGTKTPIEAFDILFQFSEENLRSDRVLQDVLILTGKEDHLIPFKMHALQVKALVNARSVTSRVFTNEEQAGSHCQMGNLGLALTTMQDWIEQKR